MDLIIHLIDAHLPAWKGKNEEQGKLNNSTTFRIIRDVSHEIHDPYLAVLTQKTSAESF